jgi:hypothetical protein
MQGTSTRARQENSTANNIPDTLDATDDIAQETPTEIEPTTNTANTIPEEAPIPDVSSIATETTEYIKVSDDHIGHTSPSKAADSTRSTPQSTTYFCISDETIDDDMIEHVDKVPVIDLQFKELEVDGIPIRNQLKKTLHSLLRLGELSVKYPDNKAIESAYHTAHTNLSSLVHVADEHNLFQEDSCYPEVKENITVSKKRRLPKKRRRNIYFTNLHPS